MNIFIIIIFLVVFPAEELLPWTLNEILRAH